MLRLVRFRFDGSNLTALSNVVPGGGHPTLHPDNRHVATDAYLYEPFTDAAGTVPLRWIDTVAGTDTQLIRVPSTPDYLSPVKQWRVDPHPAWDRSFRFVAMNGVQDNGTRGVIVADLGKLTAT